VPAGRIYIMNKVLIFSDFGDENSLARDTDDREPGGGLDKAEKIQGLTWRENQK
jgi:hypothetical protein